MTALPKYQSPVKLVKTPAKVPKKASVIRHRPQNYGAIAAEVGIKVLVNAVLCSAAVTALYQLIPYQLSQQTKLNELELERAETDARVSRLRQEFEFNADPTQVQRVMQEHSTKVKANQVRVVFVEPETSSDPMEVARKNSEQSN